MARNCKMSGAVVIRDMVSVKIDGNVFDTVVARLTYKADTGYKVSVGVYDLSKSGRSVGIRSYDLGKLGARRSAKSDKSMAVIAISMVGNMYRDLCGSLGFDWRGTCGKLNDAVLKAW